MCLNRQHCMRACKVRNVDDRLGDDQILLIDVFKHCQPARWRRYNKAFRRRCKTTHNHSCTERSMPPATGEYQNWQWCHIRANTGSSPSLIRNVMRCALALIFYSQTRLPPRPIHHTTHCPWPRRASSKRHKISVHISTAVAKAKTPGTSRS